MASENKNKKPMVFIILGIIFIIITVITILVFGVTGIFKIIGTILVIGIVCALIFALVYLFWYLFLKKHRFDVTYVNKQKLIEAGKLNHQKGVLNDLYLSGDDGHQRIKFGKIIGYCRIQILSKTYVKDKKGEPKTEEIKGEKHFISKIGKEEQDVFVISQGGLLSFFSEPMVIRVSPESCSDLVGDVTLKGYSLIPMSEYWFLNSDHLDVRKIDYAILKEAQRGIMFENLRDMKEIVDRAVGLDSNHKKDIEKKDMFDMPTGEGGQ